jgi:hypothetical protein
MLKCNDTTRLIASDEVVGASRPRRFAVWFHLLMCRHCRQYAAQLRAIAEASRKTVRDTAPDLERLAALESSINRQANEKGRTP